MKDLEAIRIVDLKRERAKGRQVAEREFNKDVQARKLYDFLLELEREEPSKKSQGKR